MPSRRPPLIGITCTEIESARVHHPPHVGQNRSYVRAIAHAGGAPLLIPNLTDPILLRRLYEALDGLLLPGGADVDPGRFGEMPHEKLGSIDAIRDETEITLARWAMEEGLPLLAICRGLQVLNVAQGGSLVQDIQSQIPDAQQHDWYAEFPRDHLSHSVTILPDAKLADIMEDTTLKVNSLHHQSVKVVAPGLLITAHAPDGVIEAAEAAEQPFVIGVQWHPEELVDHRQHKHKIFVALIEACQP